ncbi:MAG: hypothetical protein AB7N73_10050 [Gemmatimonadales bacterium]
MREIESGKLIQPSTIRGWLEQLEGIPFKGTGARYREMTDGHVLCGWPRLEIGSLGVRFGLIRREDLPLVEFEGQVSDLRLRENEGLLEASHARFHRDGIVVSEFNFFGPRLVRLFEYLHAVLGDEVPACSVRQLLRGDIVQQLDQLSALTRLRISGGPEVKGILKNVDDSLHDVFRSGALASAGESGVVVDMTLKVDARTGAVLSRDLLTSVRELVRAKSARAVLQHLEVAGPVAVEGHIVRLDLLEDAMVLERDFPTRTGRSRGIDTAKAYAVLDEAATFARSKGLL